MIFAIAILFILRCVVYVYVGYGLVVPRYLYKLNGIIAIVIYCMSMRNM